MTELLNNKEDKIDQNLDRPSSQLSDETIDSLLELGRVLERIHRRLLAEGYTIEGGKIYKKIYNT